MTTRRHLVPPAPAWLVVAALCILGAHVDGAAARDVVHEIKVAHPGNSEAGATPLKLVQQLDERGDSAGFYCDTNSVFCTDAVCSVVTVRIFWNAVGRYHHYQVPAGRVLEKNEGEPFTAADHQRLHRILADRSSPLSAVRLADIKGHEAVPEGVDAVSRATPTLYEDAAVKGAAWTSFTLWHWANGEVCDKIRDITAGGCEIADLRTYLAADDLDYRAFALKRLLRRRAYDRETIQAVRRHAPKGDREVIELAIEFFEKGPEASYFQSMEHLFAADDPWERLSVLDALLEADGDPTREFLDRFSRHLPKVQSYQEAHRLLRFYEEPDRATPEVVAQAFRLLEHESFFIARRAYWFLETQSVTPAQAAKLDAFRERHRDRLL